MVTPEHSPEWRPLFKKDAEKGASIVYIAEETPSLATVLRLYAHQGIGDLRPDFQVIPRLTPRRSRGVASYDFLSIFSTHPNIEEELWTSASSVFFGVNLKASEPNKTWDDQDSQYFVWKRLKSYVHQSNRTRRKTARTVLIDSKFSPALYDAFTGIQVRHFGDPTTICKQGFELFSYLIANRIDPVRARGLGEFEEYRDWKNILIWQRQAFEKFSQENPEKKAQHNLDNLHVSFPKLKRDPEGNIRAGETEIERNEKGEEIHPVVDLPLGALRVLEEERLSVVVVGPPGSGKTSLVVSLLYHADSFIKKIKDENPQLSDLNLNFGYMDLDEWTPDARRLLSPEMGLERKRTPWDQNLASRVFRDYLSAKKGDAQIIFADSPGGELDPEKKVFRPNEILKTVTAPADAAIIISTEYEQHKAYRQALQEVGIQPIAFVHSRPETEVDLQTGLPIESAITKFHKEKGFLSGRVVGLSREIKTQDELLEKMTPIILLHILPRLVIAKRNKIKYQLSTWSNEQFDRLFYDAAEVQRYLNAQQSN